MWGFFPERAAVILEEGEGVSSLFLRKFLAV
jgi:hypothetical protein